MQTQPSREHEITTGARRVNLRRSCTPVPVAAPGMPPLLKKA